MLECGMLEQDRRALRRRSAVLCKQLVVDELLIQSLQADDILTESMAEGIMAEQTSQKRSWRLLLLLPKRGPKAFSSFCSALLETEQQHLYDLLTQSPERDGRETRVESIQPEEEPEGEVEQLVMQATEKMIELHGCLQTSSVDREEKSKMSSTSSCPGRASDGPSQGERQRTKKRGRDKKTDRFVDSSLPLSTQEGIAAKKARTHESMEFSLDADSPINTPVLPCTPDFYLSHCQQSYRMNSSPRGFALVISNVTFDPCAAPDLDPRKGGEVDDEVLRKVFTELDYLVTVHRDLSAQGMRTCIENFCRRPEHRTVDSCVVCLLSHGVEGAIYGTDGQLLQLDWVFEAFDNSHCPLLQNKPKMFFIQACRGEEMDCGVEQIDGPARTCSPSCEQRDAGREGQGDADSRQRGDMGRPRIKLPQRSDMICGYASLKGQRICTAAMRNTKRGSWFIQEINTTLRLHARDKHLADILVQVNGRIKEREGYAPGTAHHRCKEMSEFTSSLCKDLFLFPKYQHQY
ncbi:caspase-2 isoform X1 [Sparus aurata]|uniref:caspase-2 isoform X1 n=1 Tax=Sparus aurata TaxID=8175 RepID=UPI0011C19D68|nr:caspase-2 isoform X1 [Sparus aurata]XP_030250897.1 caspase-2 isoform X1 [Sparus aurata]XP_030250898.1 caspase-2 isoform X1 [Sparus aurata]XP_030250899.1 caspase-2 isoform X1 [Sparus aurata]